jgi:hypothetical protein
VWTYLEADESAHIRGVVMAWRNWNDDDELLLDIGEALRPEPLEAEVLAAARAVRARRSADVDRAPAALLHDSEPDRTASVRGPLSGAPRNLAFALGESRVEIELGDAGVEGRLIPPEPGRVRLFNGAGLVAEATADEVGCFALPTRRPGPIRIECQVAGRRAATEWITI